MSTPRRPRPSKRARPLSSPTAEDLETVVRPHDPPSTRDTHKGEHRIMLWATSPNGVPYHYRGHAGRIALKRAELVAAGYHSFLEEP